MRFGFVLGGVFSLVFFFFFLKVFSSLLIF